MNEGRVDRGPLQADELSDAWRVLDLEERVDGFRLLPPADAEEFFLALATRDQMELVRALQPAERRLWVRRLAPDDAADLLQDAPVEEREHLMSLFDGPTRREVTSLLAYEEDDAGGLMSPRFARVRPQMSVDEAILYLRKQATERLETIYYCYVLDREQRLLGVVSFRELFLAKGESRVEEVMHTDLVTIPEDMDQEKVGRVFAAHDLMALPVVDAERRMKGIVTVDDIVDVVQEEATEDIHKIGGSEALDAPYLEISLVEMLRKRAGWMTVLFIGGIFTVSAMGRFLGIIEKVKVLAIFLPLLIASGGNSGSQASTLVIRAMGLGEVRMRDWWRILRRELATSFSIGLLLGLMGMVIVLLLPGNSSAESWSTLGLTILFSVLAIVMWGSVMGAMLPLVLRRMGFDPASASAPLVATLVDGTGVLIYFTLASVFLRNFLG